MDQTIQNLSLLSTLANIRRMTGEVPSVAEPNSVVEMLLNPDFIPPDLTSSREVTNNAPNLYDDLPPLEDDASSSPTPSPPSSQACEPLLEIDDDDDTPPLEDDTLHSSDDDGPPPLESEDEAMSASEPSTTPLTHSHLALLQADLAMLDLQRPSEDGTLAASRSRGANARDDDTRSDNSLPDLQSVSDSSSDSSDSESMPSMATVSDSSDEEDWVDEDDEDDSDEELGASLPRDPLLLAALRSMLPRTLLERAVSVCFLMPYIQVLMTI